MEELRRKIEALEAKETRTPMQDAILDKLKKELESVSSGNTSKAEVKSMFFNKDDVPKIENIATGLIEPNPYQPRRHFRETEVVDLAAAIKSKGLIEPIVITKRNGKATLIAGQKRLKAYIHLNEQENKDGLEPIEMQYLSIPCYILEIQKEIDLAILSIAENTGRENPFVLDTAIAIKILFEMLKVDDPKLSQNKYSEMAKEYFGIKSKGTISKYLQIASIDEAVQEEIFKKGIDSFTELYLLAKSTLPPQEQIELIRQNKLSKLAAAKEETTEIVEEGEEDSEIFEPEEQGEAREKTPKQEKLPAQKKSKSKIDIRYLIDTIKNLSATPIEDKKRLEEELLEYLSEFEE